MHLFFYTLNTVGVQIFYIFRVSSACGKISSCKNFVPAKNLQYHTHRHSSIEPHGKMQLASQFGRETNEVISLLTSVQQCLS